MASTADHPSSGFQQPRDGDALMLYPEPPQPHLIFGPADVSVPARSSGGIPNTMGPKPTNTNQNSPGLYEYRDDEWRLPSSSLSVTSTPSLISSSSTTPFSNLGRSGPVQEWVAQLSVKPTIVNNDDTGGPEYGGFPIHGMEDDTFDFTQLHYKGFVDPSLIIPDMNQPMPMSSDLTSPNPNTGAFIYPTGEYHNGDNPNKEKQRCIYPDCGKVFKDLKAHMLTHQVKRPEKCPIQTCEYHVKGFARKYDKNRHTLTHYKEIMVCGFCPGSGSPTEKCFNRADVFKRHLTAVHGVEQTPPNSSKKAFASISSSKKLTGYAADAAGKCSTCSRYFSNAQDFYEHLDDCILHIIQQESESPAERDLVEKVQGVTEAEKNGNIDEDEDIPKSVISPASKNTNPLVRVQKSRARKRRDYPSSWGYDKGLMTMKKRVMAVFDGPLRLAKDDMMLPTEHEIRIRLSDDKRFITDLDCQTLTRAEGFHSSTDEEKGPWISDDPTEEQLEEMQRMLKTYSAIGDASRTTLSEGTPSLTWGVPTKETPGDDMSHHKTNFSPGCDANAKEETTSTTKINLNAVGIAQLSSSDSPRQEPEGHMIKREPREGLSSPAQETKFDIPVQISPNLSAASTPSTDAISITTTSSSSSDMASSPDSIPSPQMMASSRKEIIIRRVLQKLLTWLDSRLTLLEFQCDSGNSSPVASDQPKSPNQGENQNGKQRNRQKRSRGQDEGKDSGNEDTDKEGDDNDGPRETKRVNMGAGDEREFACPFFQRNRQKYKSWRCCAWSGRKSVHRVKEHVYRKHRLPKFRCNRCCEEFKTLNLLLVHQRSTVACEVRTIDLQEGINEEQFQQLRSRRKPNGILSEEEKWNEMYRIVFPHDELIPSPYHDYTLQKDLEGEDTFDGRSSMLRDLGDHARRELPRLMRPGLENMLDSVIEEGLTPDRVVQLAQGVFKQILHDFKTLSGEPPGSFPAGTDTVGKRRPKLTDIPAQDESSAGINMDEQSVSPKAKEPHMEQSVPSKILQGTSISQNSLGIMDIFQTTVLDPLDNSQWLSFDDFFNMSGDNARWTDSGYQSLDSSSLDEARGLQSLSG